MAKRWESDSQVTGLSISRGQAYVFRYGLNGRWDRQLKIGNVGEISLSKARERAMGFRLAVLAGEDPAAMKRERKTDKTLADLYPAFMERWARPRKSEEAASTMTGIFAITC